MSYKPKTSSLLARQSQTDGSVEDFDKAVDSEVQDTISALRWSPKANWLAASSWDGKVHIYDVANDLTAKGVGRIDAGTPMFTCDWNQEGSIVAGAGADKKVYLCSANDGSTTSFVAHDAPVRSLRFVSLSNGPADVIVTGSWDRTVRYWDVRNTGSPMATLHCKERVYSMDAAADLLTIATADRHIHIVSLKDDHSAFKDTTTSDPLRYQTSVIAVMPGGKGYGVGSIEGRASVKVIPEIKSQCFSFRCHRHETAGSVSFTNKPANSNPTSAKTAEKPQDVFAVNAINFHPTRASTFVTAGSDGGVSFWDRVQRVRKYYLPRRDGAITAAAFNADGKVYAYAIGYDWSKGYSGNSPTYPLKLMLHPVMDEKLRK